MATLLSPPPSLLWKPAIPSRPPACRRNPLPFLFCKLNSRVHSPVLGSERLDHLGLLSCSCACPLVRAPELLRGSELGLLSILLVLSAVVGSFFTLTIISFPAMNAFKRLKVSNEKLSKVVSEEVPGTLISLRLSGMEINDLTSELNNLRINLPDMNLPYLNGFACLGRPRLGFQDVAKQSCPEMVGGNLNTGDPFKAGSYIGS